MAFWSELTWIDMVVMAVIAASVALALLRGLVAEIASLAIWVLAIVAASRLAELVGQWMPQSLPAPLQQSAGFLVVLLLVLVAGKLITIALRRTVQAVGLGVVDRLLGSVFGLARGGLMVVVLAILAAMTSLPTQPAWKKAKSKGFLELGIRTAAPWLPEAIEEKIRVPQKSTSSVGDPQGAIRCVA